MKRHQLRTAACALLAATVLAAFVALAADVGGQGDPLVTLSYLNETFLSQILTKVDERLASRDGELLAEMEREVARTEEELLSRLGGGTGGSGGVAASYETVTLTGGMTLTGAAGTEVLLRSGTAYCVSAGNSTPGLVDITGGGTINNGSALVKDHLYLMSDQRALRSEGEVTLLVRGAYALG
mgnify:CR=1 FL=1